MTESRSQRRRAAQEREAPRVRLAPLGFAVASYPVGADDVQVGDVWPTPGEAEAAARFTGDPMPGFRSFVVALAPISEITTPKDPQ